jgi:hypothetical protein
MSLHPFATASAGTKALTSPKSTFSSAEVALVPMQNTAKATATAKSDRSRSRSFHGSGAAQSQRAAFQNIARNAATLVVRLSTRYAL